MADHAFLSDQISRGKYTLAPRRKGKSFVWNILAEILKEDGSVVEGVVYCRSCRRILKFVGNQTSNFVRHKCCQKLKQPNTLQPVSSADKKGALDVLSKWIVEDCRPFSSVSGSGFKSMVQFFIKIGATYGEFADVDDMLPDATTIARQCHHEASEERARISEELKEVVIRGDVSVTMDLWTDNYVRRNFLGVTLHFQKESQMVNMILGLKSMDFQQSNAANVLLKLKSLLSEFGIENMESIKFVTDRNKTIVKALEKCTRLNCSSHLFANVLDKSFNETHELSELISACKKIVKYFKKVNLQHKLNTSIKNPCPPRWNSNYIMFKSIVDNWLDILRVLSETEEYKRFVNININTLNDIVELCKNFEIIFKEMQSSSSASLCFVLPSVYKIKSLCEPSNADIAAMQNLKENISRNVCEIWESNLSMWHKAAFFLYPPAKNMQTNELELIKNFCISEMDRVSNRTVYSTSHEQLSSSNDSLLNPSRPSPSTSSDFDSPKCKNKFFFSNLLQESLEESCNTEVDKYCRVKVIMTEDFDVIRWWKDNEHHYPELSKFALRVLSIPSSSAAAERAFSLAGNIITEKRNRLEPKTLDSLLFLHSIKVNKFRNL